MTYLCDLGRQSFSFWCVAVCTELMLADRACLSAHSSDLIIAIITVLYFLYLQGDWSDLLSEGRNTNVGIDSVGAPAIPCGMVPDSANSGACRMPLCSVWAGPGEGRAGNLFIPERTKERRKEGTTRASAEKPPVNEIGGVCD